MDIKGDQEGTKSKEKQDSQEKRDSYKFKTEAQEREEACRFPKTIHLASLVGSLVGKCMRESNVKVFLGNNYI